LSFVVIERRKKNWKMAEPVAIRAALQRLGFTEAAATYITGDQNLDNLDEIALLTDDKVEGLCKVIRRPGGTVPNAAAGGGNPIPNPGIPVSMRAEDNLQLACYWLRYQKRTSRIPTAAQITLENIRSLRELKEWEEEHKDVEKPEINPKDWPRTIEAIEEYLRGCLGVTKIPLAYVVRDTQDIPAVDPAGNYANRQDELIARAPITDANGNFVPTYLSDRTRVWELLSDLTRDKDCWTYVRPAQKTRDGRMAFQRLEGHYLGENNVDNMSSKAENTLSTTTYTGEKRKWNFEKYVKVHVDQHSILEGLVQHGYSGIDERSKVRHLVNGIKTTMLDSVKTRIMSDATLRNNFESSVNLFQDFIKQTNQAEIRDIQIAAVSQKSERTSQTTNSADYSDVQPDMTVEDRYYKRSEYAKLSTAKKLGLKAKREKRGHSGKKGKGNSNKRPDRNVNSRTIKAVTHAPSSDSEAPDTDNDDDDTDEPPEKRTKRVHFPPSNRTHSALRRK